MSGSSAVNDIIIDVRDLSQRFGPQPPSLDRVNLQIRKHTVYGLVGPNGSGKTTLVKALCGLKRPSSGTATVLGFDVNRDALQLRQLVGYMSQAFSLYGDLTTFENLRFFATVQGLIGLEARRRIDEMIDLTGLAPHLAKPAQFLSGGWKQRLSLATTLLNRPPLLFLDEPTAGVDPVARRELWDLLFSIAATGTDLFVTTQYMDEVERCGQVGYLYLSKLIVSDEPGRLKRHPLVAEAGQRFIQVESNVAIHAAPWIRQRPYCLDATVFGTEVHAIVTDAVADSQVAAECRAAGFSRVAVRTIEPSLEDVFVALTRAAQREAAPGRS